MCEPFFFSVSVIIVWAKSQDGVHKPHFLKRRERRAEADRTKVLLLTSLAPYRQATPAHDVLVSAPRFYIVAFSSLARILGECWIIYSLPALFCLVFLSGDQLAHTNSTL